MEFVLNEWLPDPNYETADDDYARITDQEWAAYERAKREPWPCTSCSRQAGCWKNACFVSLSGEST